MRIHKLNNAIAIALGCAALAMITIPAQAAVIKANAGTTFATQQGLKPCSDPNGNGILE